MGLKIFGVEVVAKLGKDFWDRRMMIISPQVVNIVSFLLSSVRFNARINDIGDPNGYITRPVCLFLRSWVLVPGKVELFARVCSILQEHKLE